MDSSAEYTKSIVTMHTHNHNGGIAYTDFRMGLTSPNFRPEGLNGLIDEVAVFDRVLTGTELNDLIVTGPQAFLSKPSQDGPPLSIRQDTQSLIFSWPGENGKTYTLLEADNLRNPVWTPIRQGIQGAEPFTIYVHPIPKLRIQYYWMRED